MNCDQELFLETVEPLPVFTSHANISKGSEYICYIIVRSVRTAKGHIR